MSALHLRVPGDVTASVYTEDDRLMQNIAHDFAWFAGPVDRPDVRLEIHGTAHELPRGGHQVGRRARIRDVGDVRLVDYGRAMLRFDTRHDRGDLWGSPEGDLLWEVAYLFLMSRLGERLDRRGVHRLHAVGLAKNGRASVTFLPSGGGKSTLGLAALTRTDLGWLSDDLPLLDGERVLAFPNRMGFTEPPAGVDPIHVRAFHRLEHGLKHLVDIAPYADRVVREAALDRVILGVRRPGPTRVRRPRRRELWPALVEAVVVGVGLPQTIELVLRADARDIRDKAAIVASRWAACKRLAAADAWFIELGDDTEANIDAFLGLVTR